MKDGFQAPFSAAFLIDCTVPAAGHTQFWQHFSLSLSLSYFFDLLVNLEKVEEMSRHLGHRSLEHRAAVHPLGGGL